MSHPLSLIALAASTLALASCSEDAGRNPALSSAPAAVVQRPETGALQASIPRGWHPIDTSYGDLDSAPPVDAVLVIERDSSITISKVWLGDSISIEDRPRKMLVLQGLSGGGYLLAAEARNAVLAASEGGISGDPYYDVTVERGAVVLSMEGGSSDKWSLTYRFRLQNHGWILIGATHGGGNADHSYKYDWNLNTGQLEILESDAGNRGDGAKRIVRARSKSPVQMETFTPWSLNPSGDVWF